MTFISLLSSQCTTIENRRRRRQWIPSVHLTPSQEYIFLMVSHPHDDAHFVHIRRQFSLDGASNIIQCHRLHGARVVPALWFCAISFHHFAFGVCSHSNDWIEKCHHLLSCYLLWCQELKWFIHLRCFLRFCFIFFFCCTICVSRALEVSSRDYRLVWFSCVRNKWAHFSSAFSFHSNCISSRRRVHAAAW